MAEVDISVDQNQFMCPVCLDLLQDPVTIPCGHSYCMSCITDCWNEEEQNRIYSCPLCKQSFTSRPALAKNVVFAEMVEKLQKTRLQTAAPASVHTGSGDVECDACTGNKQKAVKSCQECRNSYCPDHLQQHENLFRGRGHNLMEATGRLQEMICPQHNKVMEIYCRTDQRCICMLCLVDGHKHHDTVTAAAERREKQRHLEENQIYLQLIIQKREKDLLDLREAVEIHKCSAQSAVEDSERIFTELIQDIEKRRSEVNQLIRDQERAAVSRAEEQLERLKLEINDLKRRNTELKQLSETQDHLHFLQSFPSVSLSGSSDSGFTVSSNLCYDDVVKSVSQFRDKLQQFSSDPMEEMSKAVKTVQVIQTPEDQTSQEFQQYSHPVLEGSSQGPRSPNPLNLLEQRKSKCLSPIPVNSFSLGTPTPVNSFSFGTPTPLNPFSLGTPTPVNSFSLGTPTPVNSFSLGTPTPVNSFSLGTPTPVNSFSLGTPTPVNSFSLGTPTPLNPFSLGTPTPVNPFSFGTPTHHNFGRGSPKPR
ncbi:E3 ubiquitin-protein ligase TRIM47-like isoform X2 [Danio aesculapii]|uniref:E3 ubiquitin-protein ligase TRIM47-like isoform X2 n=1 Tax=Danio aesculapii TaxID=1142201 RepID=UPI0024BFB509|nr:E3 ubiquitin-protein ligase TRIM47-like isoform X2 [Danio aesculapii]